MLRVKYIIGIGPLAWTLNAELFAPEAKTLAAPITFCFNWFCAFVVTKYEPEVENLIGASGAYFLFAGICGAGKFNAQFISIIEALSYSAIICN